MGWWTDLKRKTRKVGQAVGLVFTPVSSPYDDSGLTPFQRQRLQERQEQQQAIEGRLERSEAAQQVAEGVDEQRSGLMGLGAQARGPFSGATRQQFGSAAEQARMLGAGQMALADAAALQGLDQDISAYEDLGEQQRTSFGLGEAQRRASFSANRLATLGNIGSQVAAQAIQKSDERMKTDVTPGEEDIRKMLDSIQAYKFKYKGDDEDRVGVMAQDMERTPMGRSSVVDVGGVKHIVEDPSKSLAMMKYLDDRIKKLESK
tara:strand:+ start:490 stop:1272 length:783 start_codon:yes stop_codon:yes gene_type:complete